MSTNNKEKMRRDWLQGFTIENLGDYFINKYVPKNSPPNQANYLVFKGGRTPPWTLQNRHTTLKSARSAVENLQSQDT